MPLQMVRKELTGAVVTLRRQIQTAPCMTENNQMGTALRATLTFRLLSRQAEQAAGIPQNVVRRDAVSSVSLR